MSKRRRPRQLDPHDPADQLRRIIARWALVEWFSRERSFRQYVFAYLSMPSTHEALAQMRLADLAHDERAFDEVWRRQRQIIIDLLNAALQPVPAPWLWELLAIATFRAAWILFFGNVRPLAFQLDQPLASRARRLPKDQGAVIHRDVGWFFRSRMKSPPDSIGTLAREYVAEQRAHGTHLRDAKPKGLIRDGIARARTMLSDTTPTSNLRGGVLGC